MRLTGRSVAPITTAPFLANTGDDIGINENSRVSMLHYRDFRELVLGDASESSEARLLRVNSKRQELFR